MKRLLAHALMSLAMFFACNGDDGMGPNLEDFIYPIKVGNRWQYSVSMSMENFRPSTPGNTFNDSTITFNATVEIFGTDTMDAKEVHVFRALRGQFETQAAYRNETNGLFLVQGFFNNALPKGSSRLLPPALDYRLNAIRFSALPMLHNTLSNPTQLQDPIQILKYPMQVGEQWLVQESSLFGGSRTEKKIAGTETVTVAAGEFDCFKIQWFITQNNTPQDNIEQFDFVSAQGLIKRVTIAKDIVLTTETGPDPIGLIDIKIETELTSLQLP